MDVKLWTFLHDSFKLWCICCLPPHMGTLFFILFFKRNKRAPEKTFPIVLEAGRVLCTAWIELAFGSSIYPEANGCSQLEFSWVSAKDLHCLRAQGSLWQGPILAPVHTKRICPGNVYQRPSCLTRIRLHSYVSPFWGPKKGTIETDMARY